MNGLTQRIGMIVGAVTIIGATIFGAQPASAHCHHHHHYYSGYGYGNPYRYGGYGYGYGAYAPPAAYGYPVASPGYGYYPNGAGLFTRMRYSLGL
jgi:hypothetical protein